MPTINKILRVNVDPQKNPAAFLSQLNLVLSQVMQTLDEVKGFRSTVTVYQAVDLQGNIIRFNGTDYIRRNTDTDRLQIWNPDAGVEGEWRDVLGLEEIDRITSQSVEGDNTLILTDEGNDQYLTGDLGNLYIQSEDGTVYIVSTMSADTVVADNWHIDPEFTDVTGVYTMGNTYQNTSSGMVEFQIEIQLSA